MGEGETRSEVNESTASQTSPPRFAFLLSSPRPRPRTRFLLANEGGFGIEKAAIDGTNRWIPLRLLSRTSTIRKRWRGERWTARSLRREAVNCCLGVRFPSLQFRARKIRVIGRVRVMLRLNRKPAPVWVG